MPSDEADFYDPEPPFDRVCEVESARHPHSLVLLAYILRNALHDLLVMRLDADEDQVGGEAAEAPLKRQCFRYGSQHLRLELDADENSTVYMYIVHYL